VEFTAKVLGPGKRPTVFTLLDDDSKQFIVSLNLLLMEERRHVKIINTDEDLMVSIYPEQRAEDKYVVEVWYGEAFVLMHSYRFVAARDTLATFVQDLKQERERFIMTHT
jgi:hypothetical protein